jgi:hypothetical protein
MRTFVYFLCLSMLLAARSLMTGCQQAGLNTR